MVRLSTVASGALLASAAAAQDVACLVNGDNVAVVPLDTGVCSFPVPANLPTAFDFKSTDDYNVEFYYSVAQNSKYFTDIVNAGRVIEIPARALYGSAGAPLYQVHLQESPASNSTAAIRKRLLGQTQLVARDEASDFAESAKSQDGTLVGSSTFQVVDLSSAPSGAASSGAASATAPVSSGVETVPGTTDAPASTVTNEATTIITITSCSDDKCSKTTVPATLGETTVTANDEVTSYTTWCPVTDADSTSTVKDIQTTVVTITSCSDNKCSEAPVTTGVTTVTQDNTVYTTYCPLTGAKTETAATAGTTTPATKDATATSVETSFVTITSCSDNKCNPSVVPATQGESTVTVNGVQTVTTTWCPVTNSKGETATAHPTTIKSTSTGAEGTTVVEKTTYANTEATPATQGTKGTEAATPATQGTKGTEAATPATQGTKGTEAATPATQGTKGTEAATPATQGTKGTEAATQGTKGTEAATPATQGTKGTEAATQGTNGPTVAAQSTLSSSTAAGTQGSSAAVSTYEASANKLAGSLALIALPLAYLL